MGERKRTRRRWSALERELRNQYGPLVAGIDEVGRGPLAGPVVACAVIMPPDARAIPGVNDSKQLTPDERERLAILIRARCLAYALGAASSREIDRLNIYHATVLAMRRALARLSIAPDHVLVDGNPVRSLGCAHRAVVGGDARCYTVACASIVAKGHARPRDARVGPSASRVRMDQKRRIRDRRSCRGARVARRFCAPPPHVLARSGSARRRAGGHPAELADRPELIR